MNKFPGLPRYIGGIRLSVSWVARWHQAPVVERRPVGGTSARRNGVDDGDRRRCADREMLLSRRLPSCRRTLVHAARHASTKGTLPPSAAAQSTIGTQSSPASQASASPRKPLTAPPPIVKRPTPSDQPLPGLRRALGVRERPTVEKQSRKERLEQIMLNPEGVQKERQHLCVCQ